MRKTQIQQEVRLMRFKELFTQWTESRLTQQEAALILGVHERTFRRYCRSYQSDGAEGLYDDRLNKVSHNAAPVDEVAELLSIFETHYPTFTAAHFYDMYIDRHRGKRSYNWVRLTLQDAGLIKKTKKRGAHRRKRERSPMAGMMIHQDGSTHEWVEGQKWDLIVTMDDATSEVYSGFFVDEEGTHSSFQGVKETIMKQGLFCSLYTDRGSHYWHTPRAGGKVDKNNPTQFGRGLRQLGVEMIAAYSPEARGRSERLFGTVQQRLPKELALEGITDMDEANRYLNETYWPKHNKKFAVAAREQTTAFVQWLDNVASLDDILSIQEKRRVNRDNTVSYKKMSLQIPKQGNRCHFIKTNVRVNEYTDGSLAIFHGPRCLCRYDSQGNQINKESIELAA